jgi:two-component system response regulator
MDEAIKVLLVEDDPNDEELALVAFRKLGFRHEIKVIREGSEALDYLFSQGEYREKGPSTSLRVILLDLKLPKVDGLEVIKQIKQHSETKTIPIVVLSSSNHESDVRSSYKLGVNSYVVKPVDFDRYVKTVQQLGEYWLVINEWMH